MTHGVAAFFDDSIRGDAILCWLTNPVPFFANYLENLKELFAATRDVRVAAGVPAQGPAGFRRSHLAAVDAYQVASASARIGVTGFADVGVLALLTADQERASWFVSEELGKLADPGPTLNDLRETALCYLETGRNLMDTARQLHVHRNTVVYRVAKIERLLGQAARRAPVRDPGRVDPCGARRHGPLRFTPGTARMCCLVPGAAGAPGTSSAAPDVAASTRALRVLLLSLPGGSGMAGSIVPPDRQGRLPNSVPCVAG